MRKRRSWIILGGIVLVVIVVAWALTLTLPRMESPTRYNVLSGSAPQLPTAFYNSLPADQSQSDYGVAPAEGVPTADPVTLIAQKRIVIKNAALELVVQDTSAALHSIVDLADKLGGWTVTSNTYQNANRAGKSLTYGNVSIRVPAEQLDSTMQQIKALAQTVTSEKITGSDVTSQYVDLSSHLANLQAAEDQLRKIMDSATKTEDVLAVYKQLVDVRGQIEQIKGQLSFFDQSAAYSSIDITLTPSDDNQPIVIAGWQPGNTINNAISTLIQLTQSLADLLIWLVIVVLPFAVLILILYLIYRRIRRRFSPLAVPVVESVAETPAEHTDVG